MGNSDNWRGDLIDSKLAPVAIFIFNRPDHLAKTLRALTKCREFRDSPIFVFGDGARDCSDEKDVAESRTIAEEILGEKARYRFSKENKGLAESVIAGVSELVGRYGRVIVVEDDLEVSAEFLSFMNEALERYVNAEKVMQVAGYMHPVAEFSDRNCALFFPITTSWGWGTWRRAWLHFDPEATGWRKLYSNRSLRGSFNLDGSYDYSGMLRRQMVKCGGSWAIRWYWSVFSRGGVVCFPPQTLVRNTGMDGTGTHGRGFLSRFRSAENPVRENPVDFERNVAVCEADWILLKQTIRRLNGGNLGAFRDWIRRLVRR